MSFTDPSAMSPAELIAQYILSLRGEALFLPYQDYAVIDDWLTQSQGIDELLLVLSESLPEYFSKATRSKPSLVGVRNLVTKRLQALRMREAEGAN
jgi:hypothetical protein